MTEVLTIVMSGYLHVEFYRNGISGGQIGKRETRLRMVSGEGCSVDFNASCDERRSDGNLIRKDEIDFVERSRIGDDGRIVEDISSDGKGFIHALDDADSIRNDRNSTVFVFSWNTVVPRMGSSTE